MPRLFKIACLRVHFIGLPKGIEHRGKNRTSGSYDSFGGHFMQTHASCN